MNKLLVRQIKKYLKDQGSSEQIHTLFSVISESYDHYEKDRKMMERSIELSSAEMIELNEKLRKETEENGRLIYEKLKESLSLLNVDSENSVTKSKHLMLENIADLLKNEIIKRKNAEGKTKQNELHLRASQRIAHIGSWEAKINIAGNGSVVLSVSYLSDETYRILGYKPSMEVTTELFYSRVHPDDVAKVADEMNNAVVTGTIYDIEHRMVLQDGKEKIVHGRAEVIYEAGTMRPLRVMGTIQDITARKKAEAELQKTTRELKTLFENMQEVYFSVDMTSSQLIQISEACEKVYGYPAAEFTRKPDLWLDVVVEEDKQVIYGNYPIMTSGQAFTQTYRIIHANGSIRWLTTHLKPTLDTEGKVIRLDGITSDITQSKDAEIALRNSEYKFRSLIENSADAIMIVNERSEVSYASDSLYRIMGYNEEEVLGVPSYRFVHPEDLTQLKENTKKVIENPGIPYGIIYRRRRNDGNYIWCEGIATNLIHIPSVQGIVINFRDISARKEVEKALSESERKFRTLIENSSDVVTVLNEKQEIVYASDSLYRITGFRPEEVTTAESLSFVHPDDREAARKCWSKLIATANHTEHFTYRRLKKDGNYIWVESIITNFLQDPVLKGIVINFRDITERIGYEQELKAANTELLKSNKELDKFVYSVSHDLRAPLSSVLGLVEYSETETTDETMLETLGLIKSSINKLDGFVLDILDYSRNSRMEPEKELINFKGLLDELTANLKFMSKGKGDVDLRVNIENNTILYSDKTRLSIILNNLISNGIRYYNPDVPDPFVEVTIKPNGDGVEIIVKDNGIGIESKNHDKVFDMFYRISKKSVGSGLGLYIVKEAVERLHGSITLYSEKDKGSEFKIILSNIKINGYYGTGTLQTQKSYDS